MKMTRGEAMVEILSTLTACSDAGRLAGAVVTVNSFGRVRTRGDAGRREASTALLGWACTLCTKAQLTVALFFSFNSFLF